MNAQEVRFQIPEAPALRPTAEEFRDPIAYISKLTAGYAQYGVVKVIPPATWKPHFVYDRRRFVFRPRLQKPYELNALLRVRNRFFATLKKFLHLQGLKLKIPRFNGRKLNLYELHREVQRRGGYNQCDQAQLWPQVATALSFDQSCWKQLKSSYAQLLLAYELHLAKVNEDSLPANNDNRTDVQEATDSATAKRFKPSTECDVASIFCNVCGRGDSEPSLLLCDSCNAAIHTHCLLPPLKKVPTGDWHCPRCVIEECRQSMSPFGFRNDVKSFTLSAFRQFAIDFKRNYFNCDPTKVSCDDVEKQFWQLVADPTSAVTVRYGSDISTMDVCSGFPTRSSPGLSFEEKICAFSPWNLKNMPSLPGSALSFIDGQVSGVNVPWLYVGMCFSTFCWHTEDHWCYSISYLHFGDAKTWYGVPGSAAELFEETIKNLTPELFNWQPDVMHHLVTLVDPKILLEKGVPVYKLHQKAGEFVITFPRSYHAGFNNGFNCAEAVNVCPAEWLPFGRQCIQSYCADRRLCVFSHEELLCKMATSENLALPLITAVYENLNEIICLESQLRSTLPSVSSRRLTYFEKIPDDERQCSICSTTLFLSCLECGCSPPKLVCLRDVARLSCSCDLQQCTFRYRHTSQELQDLLRGFEARFGKQLELPKSNETPTKSIENVA
ncbi:lysine specific demethylase 5A [Trichuris trichiura]|uniref:[histone H3]-trimethyl-L-lysine(4) demethylase n=1 Tax=Trichuris trichiura TaxID=36087 RepID=A0A077Z3X1_TRITR|nr:lysine specific demethylase 5A [Trichuris trichiura]